MPTLINPNEREEIQRGQGWRIESLTDGTGSGAPAMAARRWFLDPHVKGPAVIHDEQEQMVYVIRGSGGVWVDDERLPLKRETVVWIEPGDGYQFEAGEEGLEILQGTVRGDEQ